MDDYDVFEENCYEKYLENGGELTFEEYLEAEMQAAEAYWESRYEESEEGEDVI